MYPSLLLHDFQTGIRHACSLVRHVLRLARGRQYPYRSRVASEPPTASCKIRAPKSEGRLERESTQIHTHKSCSLEETFLFVPPLRSVVQERKNRIQREFRSKLGLKVDFVSQGAGSSNDGNTARKFFANIPLTAAITGLDSTLLHRMSTY